MTIILHAFHVNLQLTLILYTMSLHWNCATNI